MVQESVPQRKHKKDKVDVAYWKSLILANADDDILSIANFNTANKKTKKKVYKKA